MTMQNRQINVTCLGHQITSQHFGIMEQHVWFPLSLKVNVERFGIFGNFFNKCLMFFKKGIIELGEL